MRTLAPSPTACRWAGSLIRGLGAPLGRSTGSPAGRLSTRSAPLRAAATQDSCGARTCQRVSERGVTRRVPRPSAPVRTTAYGRHGLPGVLRKRRTSPTSGSPLSARQRTRRTRDRSSTTERGPPRRTCAWRRRIGRLLSAAAGGWVASPAYVARTALSSGIRETVCSTLARPSAPVTTVAMGCQTPPARRSITTWTPARGAPVSSVRATPSAVASSARVGAADSVTVVVVAAEAGRLTPATSAKAHTTTHTRDPRDMDVTFPPDVRSNPDRVRRLDAADDQDRDVVVLGDGVVADRGAHPGDQLRR